MRDRLLISLAIAVVTIAVFSQVLHFGFLQYDDNEYVTANLHVNTGLTGANIVWAFTHSCSSNWHPVTWMSHMLDVSLFGMDAGPHHAENVLLHVANSILLFLFLMGITGSVWQSAFVAAVFAVHPMHVESVAWVAERKDVLSTLFLLLTLLAYTAYVRKPVVGRYMLVFFLLALGLMAKPMLVTAPILLLILHFWPLGRSPKTPWSSLIIEKIPLAVLSAGSCIATFIAQSAGGSVNDLAGITIASRISNALVTYVAYLRRTVWPTGLAAHYPYPVHGISPAIVAAFALLLIAVTAIVLRERMRRPFLLAGWMWFIVSLLPVIGFVQVGSQASADRYMYIPMIGLLVMIAGDVPDLVIRPAKQPTKKGKAAGNVPVRANTVVLAVPAALGLAALVVLTWFQVGYWRNGVTLFEHTVAVTEDNAVGYYHLGGAYSEERHFDKAIWAFEKALELNPGYGMAKKHLADCYAQMGQAGAAIDIYQQALKQTPNSPMAHNNLANALFDRGQVRDALNHWHEALKIDPNCLEAHISLGNALFALGALDESEKESRAAIAIDPKSAEAHNNLGMILGRRGDMAAAQSEFETALSANPRMAQAHYNLGCVAQAAKDNQSAISHYRDALRSDPGMISAHSNLAVALFSTGDFAGAWQEVHATRHYGGRPNDAFVSQLSTKMPEPPEK